MIAMSASAAMTAPAMGQEAAKPVAGCIIAALHYKGRMSEGVEIPKSVDEGLTYWMAEFDRVQPDRAKQEQLLDGAHKALEKDYATMGLAGSQKMLHVSHFLALCEVERQKREAKP
ncbi:MULTISPECIES: hypothetical protein [unclassified Phenylobacterium]|uniref:hypothetical protein n=1 Tax=unclassified Phenylobacterium TaxID=2640670 RepID=UPI0012E78F41|nr:MULTISPECIES: hypothetical protein [unclassified Phenylobacterium]